MRPFKVHEFFYALLGVFALVLSGILSFSEVGKSLLSFDNVQPYTVLIFFLTFAVLSTGLDRFGFFKFMALKCVKLAKHDGLKLFKYLFILSAIISYVAANDIVILTLTPFVLCFAQYTHIDVKSYLITMFIVANTASIGQLTSNPTNFIVASAFNLNFLENLLVMFLPTVIGLILIYFILKNIFYKKIDVKFHERRVDLNKIITDKYKCGVFFVTLILLMILFAVAPYFNLQLWFVSLACTLLAVAVSRVSVVSLVKKLPWGVIGLVACFFVILSGFEVTGMIDKLEVYMVNFMQWSGFVGFSIFTGLTAVSCGLFNNIPTTALLTAITSEWTTLNHELTAYALIIGSNVGANVTIIGSLAGIMWMHLVKNTKQRINWLDFTKYGLLASVPFVVVVCVIIYLELAIINKI